MPHLHTVCSTLDHQPAFSDGAEASELFFRVARAAGVHLVALALMPDHVHVLHRVPLQERLRAALSGYTRWRNHRRGRAGGLFGVVPEPLVRRGADKELRDQRYVELNACRARLVTDPLAWPWSTWRDRMGLALPAVRPRAHDVARWHAYATRDDYVQAKDLPYFFGQREPRDVIAAVSALTRRPVAYLRRRSAERRLLVASMRWLTPLSTADIGDLTHLTARTIRRVDPRSEPGRTLVERVAGDPRFCAIDAPLPNRRAYRGRQIRNAAGPSAAWL